MKAINIIWDAEEEELTTLPSSIEVPEYLTDEDEISDYLSNLTGFCHYGFELID